MTRSALCTDPRDRIYGILGLAPPQYVNTLKPDYALPVGKVYKGTSLAELSTSDTLNLLCHCDLRQQSTDAPSWVPNWSLNRPSRIVGSDTGFLTSGRSRSYAEYVSPSSLAVQAVICGTVMSVTSPCREEVTSLEIISAWAPPQVDRTQYVNGESMLDAFLLTLCAGEVADCTTLYQRPTLDDLRSAFAARGASQSMMNDAGASARVLSRLSAWLLGRVFVMTKGGYIGLAPCGTQIGDVVSVLLGCPLPLVLRSRSVERYQVVGSGYFHGLMYGEGIWGPCLEDGRVDLHSQSPVSSLKASTIAKQARPLPMIPALDNCLWSGESRRSPHSHSVPSQNLSL